MRYCQCGKPIPRQKERHHREREYCSDACRQRAYRARHKDEHDLKKMMQEYNERLYNTAFQEVHRETWQNELESSQELINLKNYQIEQLTYERDLFKFNTNIQQERIKILEEKVAQAEAEIARLKVLLDSYSKRKR